MDGLKSTLVHGRAQLDIVAPVNPFSFLFASSHAANVQRCCKNPSRYTTSYKLLHVPTPHYRIYIYTPWIQVEIAGCQSKLPLPYP